MSKLDEYQTAKKTHDEVCRIAKRIEAILADAVKFSEADVAKTAEAALDEAVETLGTIKIEKVPERRTAENKAQSERIKKLEATLTEINRGFQGEFGHSDLDRKNRAIRYWNKLVIEALTKGQIQI